MRGYIVPLVGLFLVVGRLAADPLVESIQKGELDAVKAALDAGADVNARDASGRPLLHVALQSRNPAIAELLLERGADIHARDPEGRTALLVSADRRRVDVAKALIERGADVNACDAQGLTALHMIAPYPKATDLAKLLLERGADPNARDKRGSTPLMRSVSNHSELTAMREALIEAGADLMARNAEGHTALHVAAEWGPLEATRLLIDSGAKVDARDLSGRTPLHVLHHGDAAAKISLLLQSGADLHARDDAGATPLHAAVGGRFPSRDLAMALIAHGARVNEEADDGSTPLDHTLSTPHGIYVDMVKLLLEHGATGSTLHSAALAGDLDKVQQLLREGADPSARDAAGRTPLDYVSFAGSSRPDIARVLVEAGADLTAQGQDLGTALHTNVSSPEVVRLLLARGADPNARGRNGETPLQRTNRAGGAEVARLLIEAGADVNATDEAGQTPLNGTCCCQDAEVVRVLLEHGADPNKGTPLVTAAEDGEMDICRILLEYGANPNKGWPIVSAASSGNVDLVRLLVKHGADPLAKSERSGHTMLHAAASKNDVAMAELALELGVNVNARDRDGRTALQRAARSAGFESDLWRFLVDRGGDPLTVDNEGLTVLDWAAIIGALDGFSRVPDDLRKQAAARNIHAAAIHGDVEAVRAFLHQGADPNERHFRDGKTPLHWAAMIRHTDVARLLIERGADVNAREANGKTPLLQACTCRGKAHGVRRDMLELLLDSGADVNARDRRGHTALHYTERVSVWADLLRERGAVK